MTTITCRWCGSEVEVYPCRSDKKFCDEECYGRWQSEERTREKAPNYKPKNRVECANCGEEKLVHDSRFEKYDNHFCDLDCYGAWCERNRVGSANQNWRGGWEPYYGPNWEQQRKQALERDEYTCQISSCSRNEDILGKSPDVHHVVPFREFGRNEYEQANRLDNLVTLCPRHHQEVERGNLDCPSPQRSHD